MAEIIDLITANGIWIFLVGAITSVLLGVIKTPIKAKVISESLSEEEKTKRSNIFDMVTYSVTYLFAFLGAIGYYLISTQSFDILEILKLSVPIYLAQSMVYGAWKKLGIKRLCQLLIRLIVKDTNGDGKITIDEAILQLKGAYKNGKIDVDTLVKDITGNMEENFEEVVTEVVQNSEITKKEEVVAEIIKNNTSEVANKEKEEGFLAIEEDGKEKEVITPKKIITF